MAITMYPLSIIGSSDLRIVKDSDVDETIEGNVADGATVLYAAYFDNTANAAISYAKFYDLDTAVTVGTTAPACILPVTASAVVLYVSTSGITFSTGIGIAAVTGAGTAGTTGPTLAMTGTFILG